MLSPKRACLAQARLAETGQVHTRALAQAESSRLSEVTSCSGEVPHLWARGGIAQARRARLSEKSRDQQPTLLAVSPKRGPVA
ncbi:hypothetical protein DEO72_LG8g2326 [Vigna unguiculata]|uniref:Uncharacterized protein n=1 Tax=Vigna unguiculata TaxID=3917 RepID=A0A4D6MS07_VIGUN|nr:hypothetical protein DEO72_LG8g2326 [Vigna unguiculata]